MSDLSQAREVLTKLLGEPEAEGEDAFRFRLRGGELWLRLLPDGRLLAAVPVGRPASGPAEEEWAAVLLRRNLARLRRAPFLETAIDPELGGVLFLRFQADARRIWLERLKTLLNEAEGLRGCLPGGRKEVAASPLSPGGWPGLRP